MRGKQFSSLIKINGIRITPADAGKTNNSTSCYIKVKDHPRGCGENSPSVKSAVPVIGSPPRMRGKLLVHNFVDNCLRITPADAGKTGIASIYSKAERDHPRGCGENSPSVKSAVPVIGSPPRMRGKLDMELFQAHYNRITPADAGKTQYRIF